MKINCHSESTLMTINGLVIDQNLGLSTNLRLNEEAEEIDARTQFKHPK